MLINSLCFQGQHKYIKCPQSSPIDAMSIGGEMHKGQL